MPSGFLKALRKVGLVEVEEPVVESAPAAGEPAPPEPVDAGPVPAAVPTEIIEALPFEQIYADGQVPPCAYPAEKVLKVLAGLRAMDLQTRKAAINAIDAADDSWRIEDVILDAERKIKALQSRKQMLSAQTQAAEAEAATSVRDREARQQSALDSVRKQIADLQALMEREVAKATADKAAALAKAQATRVAGARESLRLDQEIERLSEISTTFASPPPAH